MKWGDCRKNLLILTNLTIGNGTIDKAEVSGFFNVTERLSDLDLTMEVFRCSFDMKTCDRYPSPPPITDLCGKFEQNDGFFFEIFKTSTPSLKCPLMGIYNINFSYEFLPVFLLVPLDGYVWVATFKFVNSMTRRLVMCWNTETKIIRKRLRS